MQWNRTANPRVWEASDGRHFAMAENEPYHGGGYIARVYALPLQMPLLGQAKPERVVGTAMWGLDVEAALRKSIKMFDDDAILPKREDGFSVLQQAEEAIRRG